MIKKCLFERLDEDDSILLETASRLHGVEEVVSLLEDVPRHEDDRCVVVVVIRCRRHQLNNESINKIWQKTNQIESRGNGSIIVCVHWIVLDVEDRQPMLVLRLLTSLARPAFVRGGRAEI